METIQHINRPQEITRDFLIEIDKHLNDLVNGKASDMYEIEDLAALLFIHPTHLSNTIKQHTGKSPCDFFQHKIMDKAIELLGTDKPIREIAFILTYDPSNFNKVFKKFIGVTPGVYRKLYLKPNN